MISFSIPMKPVAKGRPRVTKRGFTYTPKKTADAEKIVALYGRQAMGSEPPSDFPIFMDLDFAISPPRSWTKKKTEAAIVGKIFPASRPDLDNYCKLVEDALNGICYKDDSQIVRLLACKRYALRDNIFVSIQEA